MVARVLVLVVSLAAVSCARARPLAEPVRDAAVSSDAGVDAALSQNRLPDAGLPPTAATTYRIESTLSVLPDRPGQGYQLHDQRLELLQTRCAPVNGQTLCVSGSLGGAR